MISPTEIIPAISHAPGTAPAPGPDSQTENFIRPRRYMAVGGIRAPMDDGLADSGFCYERYTRLACLLAPYSRDQPYRVRYRSIHHSTREWLATRLIALALVALDVRFIYWLILQLTVSPSRWLGLAGRRARRRGRWRTFPAGQHGTGLNSHADFLADKCSDRVPGLPRGPGSHPGGAGHNTPCRIPHDHCPRQGTGRTGGAYPQGRQGIVYSGLLDLWLLDEGNSDEIRRMCQRLGVHHFTRKGRGHLELNTGTFANKTKHGNHNRWLWEHAGHYDVVMFVDTDHVPLPVMAERLLGYFRDPDVAFVVAPQFYGNQHNRITRWAESAQYLFHSIIQRAGNRRSCAMLVGTNAAVRTSAIKDGYVASITEDMATSLKIHVTRSEATGRRWRSVYTPDLVAVGEGPGSWTEFFSQQARWSAGTFDALLRQVCGWPSNSARARCCTTS